MAREFVTKSSRFYCVSLKPDLCKTPMGNSTPPIPYTVKGEFADATGVSRNITSGGDPVVIDASTVIPSVTGDAPGSANGLKSGTVGKRVEHDGKSKTTTFNGERTIREGDAVWMNDKNTSGKIYERGGEAARPRIESASAPLPEKNFGDKFDDAMSAGADKINAGKGWVGGKINDFAQTGVGGKVMDGLKWVSEKTELTAVKQWKEGLAGNAMNAAEGIGGRGAGMAGSLTVAALEAIPTSLLDIIPGGGKAAGTAGKVASTAGKLEHAAADAAKLGHKAEEAAGAAGKTGHAAADAGKGEQLAAEAGGAGKPPKDGKDGGKSKRKKKPNCGQIGVYKDKRKFDNTGTNWDHVPSGRALEQAAENKLREMKTSRGKPLWDVMTPGQRTTALNAARNDAYTINLPEGIHAEASPTYKSKNKPLYKGDAASADSLKSGMKRDMDAIEKHMKDTDHPCRKNYSAARRAMSKIDPDRHLNEVLQQRLRGMKLIK